MSPAEKRVDAMIAQAEREAKAARDGAVLVNLSMVQPREVEWIRRQRWARGHVSLLVGDPGFGKTLLALDAAARVSTGTEWPEGGAPPLGNVILLTAEDGLEDTVVPRLNAVGADLKRISALTAIRQEDKERAFSLDTDIPRLEEAIHKLSPVAVFIDPLSAYLGGADSHNDAEVRGILSPLAKLAEDHNVAIVCIMHLNKTLNKALYRVSGSVGFVAAARSVFAVIPDPEAEDPLAPSTRRLFVPLKSNLAAKPETLAFTVQESGSSAKVAWQRDTISNLDVEKALLGSQKSDGGLSSGVAWLIGLLQGAGGRIEQKRIEELAHDAGIGWRTVERAKKTLAIESRRVGGLGKDGAWIWSFPGVADLGDSAVKKQVAALGETRTESADFMRALPKAATFKNEGVLPKAATFQNREGSGDLDGDPDPFEGVF